MQRTYHMIGHTIGRSTEERELVPSANHFKSASVTRKLAAEIHELGLRRVAGNVFECPAQRDFWAVNDGKLMRLSMTEVDDNESLAGAPAGDPGGFLTRILDDLTF
jgi:hypothetical protein